MVDPLELWTLDSGLCMRGCCLVDAAWLDAGCWMLDSVASLLILGLRAGKIDFRRRGRLQSIILPSNFELQG
jgi:hypothetical protein